MKELNQSVSQSSLFQLILFLFLQFQMYEQYTKMKFLEFGDKLVIQILFKLNKEWSTIILFHFCTFHVIFQNK